MAFGDTGRSFLWWHKRGRTCISVSGVFAILILWQARLSGRNVSVRRQTADNTSALSHVFPLERASVQGFGPSIIFYFCLLSWFKRRLSAYSSPVISHPLVPPPLALVLPSLQSSYFLYSHSSSLCLPLPLTGGLRSQDRERRTNLRGSRGIERVKVGHLSLAYSLCMDTVPKKVRCMEVIEKERNMGGGGWWRQRGPSSQLEGWEGIFFFLFFFPQGQGANLFISLEVTMKFYWVLCSDDERDQRP